MALSSPGVEVKVIDESFYTPAEPGTVPMIFVASAENKTNGAGTGTAPGTEAANAGKPYLITSQRDLVETFGEPKFYTDSNNNPIHGGELNEYGLQAAYSLLGVSNRAYVVRAGIDLGAITATSTAPTANPTDGTYWIDTASTMFGVFEWNGAAASTTGGQSFTNKTPIVITDSTLVTGGAPKGSVGTKGDYAIVATTTLFKTYYKNESGNWVEVGSNDWRASWAVTQGSANPTTTSGESMTINGTTVTTAGTDADAAVTAINGAGISGITADKDSNGIVRIFSNGPNVVLAAGSSTLLASLGLTAGTYYAPELSIAPHTSVPEYGTDDTTPRPTGSVWVKTTNPNKGADWSIKVWNDSTKLWEEKSASIYEDRQTAIFNMDKDGGGVNISADALFVRYNDAEASDLVANSFIICGFIYEPEIACGSLSLR